jgi:hypothetical protein
LTSCSGVRISALANAGACWNHWTSRVAGVVTVGRRRTVRHLRRFNSKVNERNRSMPLTEWPTGKSRPGSIMVAHGWSAGHGIRRRFTMAGPPPDGNGDIAGIHAWSGVRCPPRHGAHADSLDGEGRPGAVYEPGRSTSRDECGPDRCVIDPVTPLRIPSVWWPPTTPPVATEDPRPVLLLVIFSDIAEDDQARPGWSRHRRPQRVYLDGPSCRAPTLSMGWSRPGAGGVVKTTYVWRFSRGSRKGKPLTTARCT